MSDHSSRSDELMDTDRCGPADGTVSLRDAVRVWARIGLLSFGGPAGQIALMHRILVDEKRWIGESQFLHALNFCMILPGPEAQQLATYAGWMLHGTRGGLIAGSLFILPGFLVILGLSFLYVSVGSLPIAQGLFLGLKAAVIAIVLQAVVRIGRRSLNSPLRISLAATALVAMFAFAAPFPLVVLAAAGIGVLAAWHQPQHEQVPAAPQRIAGSGLISAARTSTVFGLLWLGPVALLATTLGVDDVFTAIALFFSKMAVVTFGGAYAVLAYVAQEAVQAQGWLVPGEMIDGLAMAETTPGPLIMVVQFVGFLAAYRDPGALSPGFAALLGSLLTTWVTFVPCFLWIFLGAPHIERLRQNPILTGAFSAVGAAVVGVIVNLALWFSFHALFARVESVAGLPLQFPVLSSINLPALLITAVAILLIFRLRASVPATLAVTAAMGMVLSLIHGTGTS